MDAYCLEHTELCVSMGKPDSFYECSVAVC